MLSHAPSHGSAAATVAAGGRRHLPLAGGQLASGRRRLRGGTAGCARRRAHRRRRTSTARLRLDRRGAAGVVAPPPDGSTDSPGTTRRNSLGAVEVVDAAERDLDGGGAGWLCIRSRRPPRDPRPRRRHRSRGSERRPPRRWSAMRSSCTTPATRMTRPQATARSRRVRVRTGASQVADSALRRRCHHTAATIPATTPAEMTRPTRSTAAAMLSPQTNPSRLTVVRPGRRRWHRRGVEARSRQAGRAGDDRHDAAQRADPPGHSDGDRAAVGEVPTGPTERRAQPAAPAMVRDRRFTERRPKRYPIESPATAPRTAAPITIPIGVPLALRRSAGDDQADLARDDEVRDDQTLAEHESEHEGGEGDPLGAADEVDQSIGMEVATPTRAPSNGVDRRRGFVEYTTIVVVRLRSRRGDDVRVPAARQARAGRLADVRGDRRRPDGRAIEDDLQPHDITLGDYQVFVFLSEAEGRRMRMVDLAAALHLSPSGLTRRLDGLTPRRLRRPRPVARKIGGSCSPC